MIVCEPQSSPYPESSRELSIAAVWLPRLPSSSMCCLPWLFPSCKCYYLSSLSRACAAEKYAWHIPLMPGAHCPVSFKDGVHVVSLVWKIYCCLLDLELKSPHFWKDCMFFLWILPALFFAFSLLLNASLHRPVALGPVSADTPATSVALHLLLCWTPVYLCAKKPSYIFLSVMSSLLTHAGSSFSNSFCTLLFKFFVLCACYLMMCSFFFSFPLLPFSIYHLLSLSASPVLSCMA